jgi:hypothetical protein
MPKQSKAQVIGNAGEVWFQSQLPERWLFQRPSHDVGIDGVVVVCEDGELNGKEFRVQIKASECFKKRKDMLVVPAIKFSTIQYWFYSLQPTLLIAYDIGLQKGFFRWHIEWYEELFEKRQSPPKKVSLDIPITNELNEKSWESVRDSLRNHQKNLAMTLDTARSSRSLFPTINSLIKALRVFNHCNLIISHSDLDEEQERTFVLSDIEQHLYVLSAVDKLLSELDQKCEGSVILLNWRTQYHNLIDSVIRDFDTLNPENFTPGDIKITYAQNFIHNARWKFSDMIFEMLTTLTAGKSEY